MRSKQEIDAEIAALQALKPVGKFKTKTLLSIGAALEELIDGVDQTSEEWWELNASQHDIVQQTVMWKAGDTDKRPSEGWGALVE